MQQNKRIMILVAIIVVAAFSRLIPHPMNFAPLGAMALFGSAYLNRKGLGLVVTMVAWLLSDLILNNLVYGDGSFTLFTQGAFFIYGSIALIYGIGSILLKNVSFPRVIAGSFGASVVFFVVTNFGVWVAGTMYPLSAEGLIACYTAAIPFFQSTLVGDLFYSVVLFVIYERYLKSQLVTTKVRK